MTYKGSWDQETNEEDDLGYNSKVNRSGLVDESRRLAKLFSV